MNRKIWVPALAALLGLSSAAYAADFNSAVEKVLRQQKQIKELDADRQVKMIACVKQVLADVPPQKKAYVAEGASVSEMEDRFGEVVLANQAEFEKAITRQCGGIAMEES